MTADCHGYNTDFEESCGIRWQVTRVRPMTKHIDLDDIDRRLVGELIVDGRAPYAALAPKVGLSQAAVRARVRRLLENNVVTVTARVDPRSLDLRNTTPKSVLSGLPLAE